MKREDNNLFDNNKNQVVLENDYFGEKKFKNNISYTNIQNDLSNVNTLFEKGLISQNKHIQMKKAIFERYKEKFTHNTFRINPILNGVLLFIEMVMLLILFIPSLELLYYGYFIWIDYILLGLIIIHQAVLFKRGLEQEIKKGILIASTVFSLALAVMYFIYFDGKTAFPILCVFSIILFLILLLLVFVPIEKKYFLYKFYSKKVTYEEMLRELETFEYLYNKKICTKEDFENMKIFLSNLM